MCVLVCSSMYVWEWQSERSECSESDALALPRIGLQSPAKVSHNKKDDFTSLGGELWKRVAKFQHIKAEIDFCNTVFFLRFLSISLSSESMRANINGETQNRAGLVVHERIDRHHLQIEDVLLRSRHCSGQHQHGTDVVDLLGTRNDQNKWVHE